MLVSRYIHLNPVAAGVTPLVKEYQWSSYRAYYRCRGSIGMVADKICTEYDRTISATETLSVVC